MINHPEIVFPYLLGFLLDCLIGDPNWLPHPIRLFGKLISFGEKKLNCWQETTKVESQKLRGAILALVLVLLTFLSFFFLLRILASFRYVHLVITSIFVFYGLANRSLIQESWKVIRVLKKDGIEAGRKQLSMIVGRDTENLNNNQIRTAVLETLAENLSDGVIAPLFFYALGGVPAMLAYKMANTLDSMIGYKSERYKYFGWFAAKLDDVLNIFPARITAFLMVVLTLSWRGARYVFKYGQKHRSPNAGYPEAALAGILNCRFGGSNIYHGKLVDKPFIGENTREVIDSDIRKTCVLNSVVTIVFIALLVSVFL